MAFHYFNGVMKKIITLITPRLEYAAVVWSSHRKKGVRRLRRIQRIAKLAPGISNTDPFSQNTPVLTLLHQLEE